MRRVSQSWGLPLGSCPLGQVAVAAGRSLIWAQEKPSCWPSWRLLPSLLFLLPYRDLTLGGRGALPSDVYLGPRWPSSWALADRWLPGWVWGRKRAGRHHPAEGKSLPVAPDQSGRRGWAQGCAVRLPPFRRVCECWGKCVFLWKICQWGAYEEPSGVSHTRDLGEMKLRAVTTSSGLFVHVCLCAMLDRWVRLPVQRPTLSPCFPQETWVTKDRKAVWVAMEKLVPLVLKVFVTHPLPHTPRLAAPGTENNYRRDSLAGSHVHAG